MVKTPTTNANTAAKAANNKSKAPAPKEPINANDDDKSGAHCAPP